MYIKSLTITNLRCFEQAELHFQYPRRQNQQIRFPNINLLLGNNGAGKTTILKAVALATLSPVIEGAGYVPHHLIRQGQQSAVVAAHFTLHSQDLNSSIKPQSSVRLETQVVGTRSYERLESRYENSNIWEKMYDEDSPAFLLVGYGATRRVETSDFDSANLRKIRRLRYQRVAGLFEDHITLTPLSAWLPKVKKNNSKRFTEISNLFKKLLPAGTEFTGTEEEGEFLFAQFGVNVPFSAMSDGYRAYIGWIGDLLYHLYTCCPPKQKLTSLKGIVLVDEIDLHLHPKWQSEVISIISEALPELQFVLSTHSPIVTGTLHAENIFVMEIEPSGASSVRQFQERVYGLNADQVLRSSYFGRNISRAPGFEEELRSIARKAWQGDPEAAVEYLKKLSLEQ